MIGEEDMKKIFLYTIASALLLTGCDLDINDDPNYPSSEDVTPALVFPAAENAIATCIGDQMFNYGGFFAQYFEQMPTANQYNDLAELNLDESSDLFTRCYRTLYAGALLDIKDVLDRTENTADIYACTVLRAYAYQLLVDNMSECPYTEALQASEVPSPTWDDGKTVFEGILAEMQTAESNLDESESMTLTDPMFNQDMAAWKGLANALRLRIYLRMIDGNVDASGYTAKVKQLVSDNNFFSGDLKWDVYSNAAGQYNPWYDSFYSLGTYNHCAAYPIVSYLDGTSDPRISYALAPRTKDNSYVGQLPGAKTKMGTWTGLGANYNNTYVSFIKYATSTAMPVYMFTQSELQFLIAEVQLRFNNNASAAKAAYEAGVTADFASRGVDGAAGFLASAKVNWDRQGSTADQLKLIYMQKWAALFFRDHMEAWSEIRRTDVPATSEYSAQEIYEGAMYSAGDLVEPAVNYIIGGGLSKRVPYPSVARELNTNTPTAKLLSDRVFWDAK